MWALMVVGNPLYFFVEDKGTSFRVAFETNYSTYSKGADIYCLFYERGGQILKGRWVIDLYYIQFMATGDLWRTLEKYILKNVQPVYLLNIEDAQVFEEATVESNILMFQKKIHLFHFLSVIWEARPWGFSIRILPYLCF
ncbi:MAG: Eco57I restriction-modification methylase domain-containing protein [Saprospiraceae bacterium]